MLGMEKNKGYIKLHRKLLDNPFCSKPHYGWLWVFLLLKANHKENSFLWNGEKKTLKAGQFITGRTQLSEETGIPPTTIERILKALENGQQIGQEKNNKFRIITIVNWRKYQERSQQADSKSDIQRTSSGHPADTNKNDKNDNNEKERLVNKLKDWNGRQSSPISNFKPENIINKYGFEKTEKLVSQYGPKNNGFSQFLGALKQ